MEFTDYLIWKVVAVSALALVVGYIKGRYGK